MKLSNPRRIRGEEEVAVQDGKTWDGKKERAKKRAKKRCQGREGKGVRTI
jgi:hypothetical protein